MDIPRFCDIEGLKADSLIWSAPEVVVTEKINGTNRRIANIDGQIILAGRNIAFTEENADQSMEFWAWWQERRLTPRINYMICAEWYGPGIMKGVEYADRKSLVAFDVRDLLTGGYVEHDDAQFLCLVAGMPMVPVLYRGKPDMDVFKSLIGRDSELAKRNGITKTPNAIEGIVIKPIPEMHNKWGGRIIAKLKDPKFAEKVHVPKAPIDADLAARCQAIVDAVATPQRLIHVLSYMHEEGIPTDTLESTSEVIKRMAQDVLKECQDEIAGVDWKRLHGPIGRRAADLYKQYLFDSAGWTPCLYPSS